MKATPQFYDPAGFESFYREGPDPYGYTDESRALGNWCVRVGVAAHMLEFARDLEIGNWPVERLLDVGCGEGITLRGVLDACGLEPGVVAGCDVSSTAISRCKAETCIRGARSDFRVVGLGWGEGLPWPDASFDLVFVFGVLYSLTRQADLQQALRELVRVTSRGGLLLLMHIETSCPESADGYRTCMASLGVEGAVDPVLEHRFQAGRAGLTRGVLYRRDGVAHPRPSSVRLSGGASRTL